MAYNRFTLGVTVQSILTGLAGTMFVWTLYQDYLLIAKFTAGGVWLCLLLYMIYYVKRTNRSLTQFLQTVRHLDSSKPLPSGNKGSFDLLSLTYNDIIDSIQEVKISKEAEYQYFRNVIENAATGLIAFDQQGKVEMINRSAQAILGLNSPQQLSDFDRRIEGFSELLMQMKPGVNNLSKVIIGGEMVSLSLRKALFVKQSREISLISLHNIRNELEEEELEVWQKLISVLTHEIMNSVSPIKSLTGTLVTLVEKTGIEPQKEDMLSGLKAIETRSKGLLKFVDSYRNLTRVPSPVFQELSVGKLLSEVAILMKEEGSMNQIKLGTSVHPPDLNIYADEKLISQVLINLISNAIYALKECGGGKIELIAYQDEEERTRIKVKDNGKGIPAEIIDKIFIPFYTTREKGSGIGLSLARQIMHMHNASIRVTSSPGTGCTFNLVF
jgi:nitrogen fixation/metabolism regulation signal transduction histidine kinase